MSEKIQALVDELNEIIKQRQGEEQRLQKAFPPASRPQRETERIEELKGFIRGLRYATAAISELTR